MPGAGHKPGSLNSQLLEGGTTPSASVPSSPLHLGSHPPAPPSEPAHEELSSVGRWGCPARPTPSSHFLARLPVQLTPKRACLASFLSHHARRQTPNTGPWVSGCYSPQSLTPVPTCSPWPETWLQPGFLPATPEASGALCPTATGSGHVFPALQHKSSHWVPQLCAQNDLQH